MPYMSIGPDAVWWIWLGFTLAFSALAVGHLRAAGQSLPHFPRLGAVAKINGLTTGIRETTEALNQHIDRLNADSRRANLLACAGYVLATLTALVSLWLTQ
jgi:hypothetical protein